MLMWAPLPTTTRCGPRRWWPKGGGPTAPLPTPSTGSTTTSRVPAFPHRVPRSRVFFEAFSQRGAGSTAPRAPRGDQQAVWRARSALRWARWVAYLASRAHRLPAVRRRASRCRRAASSASCCRDRARASWISNIVVPSWSWTGTVLVDGHGCRGAESFIGSPLRVVRGPRNGLRSVDRRRGADR